MQLAKIKPGSFSLDFSHNGKFKLCSFNHIFSDESYHQLQQAFSTLEWDQKTTDFYSQYETVITPHQDNLLSRIYDKAFFMPFKEQLEEVLQTKIRDHIRLIAHKLVTADEIKIHNDYCDPSMGYENYRFIFQLSHPEHISEGGTLYFLNSPTCSDMIRQYPPSSNTGICFQITPHSYHYVSAIKGQRYTLIMYLWDKSSLYDGSGFEVCE